VSHHLSTSLSASAASALHVLGGRLRSFAPSPRVVLGVAALTSAGVLGIAGVGVASSHTSVMLSEVDIRIMNKLGLQLTSEPRYENKKIYH